MNHGVIMAGGSGTRFWPKSRKKTPKQLLAITGEESMIKQTYERLTPRIPPERLHVITNQDQVDGVIECLPDMARHNVVAEPCSRNTAACIGLAAIRIAKTDPDATMVVMTADSYIDPTSAFLEVIDAASDIAEEENAMVVIGIPPTYPSTGYGYIHRGREVPSESHVKTFDVLEFKEKPDEETAKRFVNSGEYYWNSGSFIWKISTIMDAFEEYMPELHAALRRIADKLGTPDEEDTISREYQKLESMSIDYGVMEHAKKVKVVEATYRWDDVGSWRSLEDVRECDPEGNVREGKLLLLDTSNSTIIGDHNHLIATVGVDNLVVVHTPDATLICPKERAQDVKKIVDVLRESEMDEYL